MKVATKTATFFYSLEKLIKYFKSQYSLDYRALAIMRIGLGVCLILDIVFRIVHLTAFQTGEGVLPISCFGKDYMTMPYLSLHSLNDSYSYQLGLAIIAMVFYFLFLIGYKARLMAFFSWFMLCSLHARNCFVLQGGDELLRFALFWCMFMPISNRYSYDSRIRNSSLIKNDYFHVPALGLGLLVFSVYFFSALLKTSTEWRSEGTALYYALSIDQMTFPSANLIYHSPALLKVLSLYVFYLELLVGFLFFIPFKNNLFRTLGVVLIVTLHLGIASTMMVGLFPLIGIVTAIGLLPGKTMDWLEPRYIKVSAGIKKMFPLKFKTQYSNEQSSIEVVRENYYVQLVKNSFLFFVIAFSALWSIANLNVGIIVSPRFKPMADLLRLEHNWGMFSPSVFKNDGWTVVEAKTTKGELIDINNNGAKLSFAKPAQVLNYYNGDRWRKYQENMLNDSFEALRKHYGSYLFNKWNSEHKDNKIVSLKIIYCKEETAPNYKYVKPVNDTLCVYEPK